MPEPACEKCGAHLIGGEACPRCMLRTGFGEDRASVAERIFQVALAHPEDERDSFIQHAAGSDAGLLADVAMLLGGYREEGGDAAAATLGGATTSRMDLAITPSEEPGTTIDHFRLVRLVGEGGMGTVWEAQQTGTVQRTVALKVIKLGMDTREVVARFERERQTLALMKHPNIAQVFEAGATRMGRPYFAMEFVDGEPITDYCDRERLDVHQRLRLFMDVCGAVQHAHQKGIIHRDIKPSNILVSGGLAKVIDFGVAKATRSDPLLGETLHTRQSQILGTPAYMSPEQAGGSSEDIDTRTDIYALGTLLYELLTGATPVDARRISRASPAELERILQNEIPVRPSIRLATSESFKIPPHLVRGDLDWITMKCLAKDRTDRYATANALASDIGRHLRNEPVSAAAPTPWYHLVKWAARNRVAFLAGLAVALSMTIATIVSIWQASIAGAEARNAQTARDKTQSLLESAHHEAGKSLLTRALALANEKELFRAKLRAGQAIGFDGFGRSEAGAAFRERVPNLLRQGSPEANEARRILNRSGNYTLLWQSPYTAHHDGRTTSVSYNQDGTLLATCSPTDNTVHIWNPVDGERLRQIKTVRPPWTVCFSPDGSLLAVGGESDHLQLIKPDNGDLVRVLDGCSGTVTRIQFSFDGKELSATDGSGLVRFWNPSTGDALDSLGTAGNALIDFALSRDNSTLVTAGLDEIVRVWDRKSREIKWAFSAVGNDPFALALDHSGTTLFAGLGSGQIETWDLQSGELKPRIFKDHLQAICRLKISPDGLLIASVGWDSETRISRIIDGSEVSLLQGHSTSVLDAAFSPDNATIASVSNDNTVRIWNRATNKELFPVIGHSKKIECVKFSRDGQYLASAGDDRGIQIWNLRSGNSQPIVSGHVRDIVAVDFAPSGRLLASVCQYGIIRFWNPASGERLRRAAIRHRDCTSLRFLSESTLATAGEDGTVRVWNLGDGKQVQTLSGHDGIVSAIDVSPALGFLASGGRDRAVVLWDLRSGSQVARFAGHTNAVSAVRFHPDGKILASADESGIIRFWDLETGLLTNSMNACPKEIAAIDFSPNGTKLAAAEAAGSIYLFGMGTGKLEAVLDGHNGNVNDVAFSQDGTLIATASSDRTVALWEAQGPDRATICAHDSGVLAMDWTAAGIITSDPSDFRRWDSDNFQQTESWDIGDVEVTAVDQQADQKRIALGTSGGDVYILQSTGTTIQHSIHAHNDRIDAVRCSPDGRQLATVGKDRWVRLWDLDSMKLVHEIDLADTADSHPVPYSLCFSHDGTRLFCAGGPDGSIHTFQTSTLSRSVTLQGHTLSTRAVSAHPTQPILASASADETIRLWNSEDLQVIATLAGHSGEVYDVRFDSTGRKLASASEDQTVIVWDIETRSKFEVLEGHVGTVRSVRFDSSGDRLASTGDDGYVRLWDLKQADGSRYAMDYEKFRTDGLAFNANLPAISSRLDAPIRPPSMEISPASQLGALRTTAVEPARLLFWRSLLACNWSAAHLQWQSLPVDARATEQLALGRALARIVQSARNAGQREFNDSLLQIAESTGDTQPEVQTARAILTLHSNPSEQGLDAVLRALGQLPPTAKDEKRRLLQECLRFDLERDALSSAKDHLQALVSLAGQGNAFDRSYDAYAAKYLSVLKASLSPDNSIGVVGLRGLTLVEQCRQAIALSPFESSLLESLLEVLTQWNSTLNPPLAIISSASDWHYLDHGTDPGTAWNQYPFNDQSWGTGQAPLGFGSKSKTTTPVRRNASNLSTDPSWMTFHFRHTFSKPELGPRDHLLLHCDYDDGMIAYLNGSEIGRVNMPLAPVTIETPASVYQSEPGRSTFLLKSALLQQDNVVAVEVHQREPSSSDIYFDLNLSAIGATPETYLASIDGHEIAESLDWVQNELLPPALAHQWMPALEFALSDQATAVPAHMDPALCWLARARIQAQRDRAEAAQQAMREAINLARAGNSILHKGILQSAQSELSPK